MPASTYLRGKTIDAFRGTSTFTAIAQRYVSLHTGDPGLSGTNNEVDTTSTGYARQRASGNTVLNFDAAVVVGDASVSQSLQVVTFGPALLAWGTILYFGVWDAVTGVNFLVYDVAPTKTVNVNDTYSFPIGAIDLSVR